MFPTIGPGDPGDVRSMSLACAADVIGRQSPSEGSPSYYIATEVVERRRSR